MSKILVGNLKMPCFSLVYYILSLKIGYYYCAFMHSSREPRFFIVLYDSLG